MTQPDATQLHQFLVDHFSLEEFKTLCFNLGVEYEDLGGEGRSDKARELVRAMQRRTRLEHLVAHLSIARPDPYRQRFHETPSIPVASARARRDPRQVFISHAHQDASFAQRLARDLRARGFPVWISPDSIRVGEDWPDAIDRGLDESGVFVVALTAYALTSHWVRKEMSTARLLEGRGLIQLLLLYVADCDLPSSWRTYQFATFRNSYESGLSQLLDRLERHASQPSVTSEPFRRPKPVETGHTPVATPQPDRRIHSKTGIELIRIPAGPFLYGTSAGDATAEDNEKPERQITLAEFWIGRYPVTNIQYKRFLDANRNYPVPFMEEFAGFGLNTKISKYSWDRRLRTFPAGMADYPVVLVSWKDAKAFCDWAGLMLPTEEQWEKAARGVDGRIWPWGSELPTPDRCQTVIGGNIPVGKYSPKGDSPYGCADMIASVAEWTGSWYEKTWYGKGVSRVTRGGGAALRRIMYRHFALPDYGSAGIGFRVVELLSDSGF